MAVLVHDEALDIRLARDDSVYGLAEGTELLGEYQGSGYQTPKFLVSRADGQVMQLPRLLYRLLGSLDGRSAEEIARALTPELGEELSGEQVSVLVNERLRPVGLIASDDDDDDVDDEGPAVVAAPVKPDPLLYLRFRVGIVPASTAWRIAGVFTVFFRRPVWVTVLTAFVIADVLIALRGNGVDRLAAGFTQVVERPQLNLAIVGLLIGSLALHECGHVAACRYGGARPGNMGVGIYLVWPAFYSTVTDAYRLNRTGRLRTDFGGVYFNVLFLAATALVYLETGQPWLLVAVLALHTETAWQFLPSIRLDGYYMLADLVGVPELFSYVGPVLKSLVPGRPPHPRVHELRRSSRRVIVLWVSLGVPVLLAYLTVFLLAAPRALGLLGSEVLDYRGAAQAALRAGDVPIVSLTMLELLLLLLPWAGLTLITVTILRMIWHAAAAHWDWAWNSATTWAVVRRWAAVLTVASLTVAFLRRLVGVAGAAPAGEGESRIAASALGIDRLGRAMAPQVAPREVPVREQLVAYARLTGAFDGHADVLTGGRELAVVACIVLVVCFLALALTLRWRWWAVAVPLACVAAMGPAVSVLATFGPGIVGAAWTAIGITFLVLATTRRAARHRRSRSVLPRLLLVLGVAALAAGVFTEPLVAVPLAVGGVLLVTRLGGAVRRPEWVLLFLGASVLTAVAGASVPSLLGMPATSAMGHAERQVLLAGAALLVAGGVALRRVRLMAVISGALVVLAAVPAPGAAAVLPLVVCAAAGLGALVVQTWTHPLVGARPHPLLRTALAVPVLVVVAVGALYPSTPAPDAAHRQLGQGISRSSPTGGDGAVSRPVTGSRDVDGSGVERVPFDVRGPR